MSDPLLPEITGHLLAAMDGDIAPSSLRALSRRLIDQVRADERARIRAGVAQFGNVSSSTPKRMSDGIVSIVLVDVTDALLAVISGAAIDGEATPHDDVVAHIDESTIVMQRLAPVFTVGQRVRVKPMTRIEGVIDHVIGHKFYLEGHSDWFAADELAAIDGEA